MKYSLHFQLVFLAIFLLVIALTFIGTIHFGNGLGDLIYLFLAGAISIANFLLLFAARKSLSKNKEVFIIFTLINIAILSYLIYSFTIGRGVELPWDGRVFF